MFPAYVDVRRAPATPTLLDRVRELAGGDDDDPPADDNAATLVELIQDFVQSLYERNPPLWTTEQATDAAIDAVHHTVPVVTLALMHNPTEMNALIVHADRIQRSPARSGSAERKPLSRHDRRAIECFANAVDPNPEESSYRLSQLQFAQEYVISRYLTQSQTAALLTTLTRQVAIGTGRKADTHGTTDAASARLQVIADQFIALDAEQQQHVAALVAALANQTPDRPKSIRAALRRFIEHVLGLEDLVYFGQQVTAILGRWASGTERPHPLKVGPPPGRQWSFAHSNLRWTEIVRDPSGHLGCRYIPTTDPKAIAAIRKYVARRAVEASTPIGEYVRTVVIPDLEVNHHAQEHEMSVAVETARQIFRHELSDETTDPQQ